MRRFSAAAVLAAVFALAGCETVEVNHAPPVELPARFAATGGQALPDKWWESFDDPVLDELIEKALAANLTVKSAWERLAQAEATAKKAGVDLLPTLDADVGATGTRQKKAVSSTSDRNVIENTPEFSLGLTSSYEIDLWGAIRSTRDAARYDVDASEEDLKTAAITLSAEIAATWYELVEKYGQIDLIGEQIDTNEKVLELTTLRFRRGQVTATDVLQQRQLVESNQGDLILARSQARVIEHELAVLLGVAPGTLEIPTVNALVTLPPLPATGIPADLVRRRPDVRKAHFDVLAADRRTAAAIADRFPQLTMTASVSTSAAYVHSLFETWIASLAANLVAPLFDAGERKAEVERTRAVTAEALNDYGQAVLESLKEVEDALVEENSQRRYIASLEKQIDLAGQAADRARDTYIGGGTDFLRVLDALLTDQSLERSYLEAQRQLIRYRIDLCKALGGGWQMTRPESTMPDPDKQGE